MRGSRWILARPVPFCGIIPAHAGLTYNHRLAKVEKRDHPRACGAHAPRDSIDAPGAGSSPRMRGSRLALLFCRRAEGIIPAHAGLTICQNGQLRPLGDHPRACGAHEEVPIDLNDTEGSSPRMRGSPRHDCPADALPGIIPAHAGLTGCGQASLLRCGDHPRACGAHPSDFAERRRSAGSSPRMRGSHPLIALDVTDAGIIPAHAGLTWPSARRRCWRRDHPRACGAHKRYVTEVVVNEGSSPRMRGSQLCRRLLHGIYGIIPAHAGLTDDCGRQSRLPRDHPRACGAHTPHIRISFRCQGSSPRMRGSHRLAAFLVIHRRIIPAHAGLTSLAFLLL